MSITPVPLRVISDSPLTVRDEAVSPDVSTPTSSSDASAISMGGDDSDILPARKRIMDPWTAGEKIIAFLSKKVRASKGLFNFRKDLIEKRAASSPGKQTFKIEEIPIARLGEIARLTELWNRRVAELLEEPTINEDDKEKLNRAQVILESIKLEYLDIRMNPRRKSCIDPTTLFVAKDMDGNVQAIAQITRPYKRGKEILHLDYRVDYLLTSPENLRLSIQTSCVSGSATALIEEVVFRSMRNTMKQRVSLEAAEKAIPFYERLGFHCVDPEENEFVLTGENLRRFLSNFGGFALHTA